MTACGCWCRSPFRLSRRRLREFLGGVKYGGELVACRLVGIVEAERRHRDEVRANRPKVRAFAWLSAAWLDADPIIGPPPRIEPILNTQKSRITYALDGCRNTLYGSRLAIWIVDVDYHAFGPSYAEELAYEVG